MKTLADFQPLKSAEQKLLECCQSGEIAFIGEERPTEKREENEIRADFLRCLILTKEIEIDPNGIMFQGGWISDRLDLDYVRCLYVLGFVKSVFEKPLGLIRSIMRSVYLDGSLFYEGILADGLMCKQNFHLRNTTFKNEARFVGANIHGDFDCDHAKFLENEDSRIVLNCDGIKVSGSIFLRNSTCEGEVRLLGAHIERNLECDRSIFKAKNQKYKVLDCDGIHVKGGLFFRNECFVYGGIALNSAVVGSLVDDKYFWEQETLTIVHLDGFKYEHIYGDTSASFRLKKMFGKMTEFTPQPYKQLAKVLRNMGHDRDADEVMIALRNKQLDESKESLLYIVFRYIYKWTSEYGYRPMRILKIMASIWALFGCIYWYGANVGVFAPSNPLIFQKDYNGTIDKNGTKWLASPKDYNASNNWYEASPPEYTTFQPFWYSLDIILPVVDLKMEKDWGVVIPSPDGSFFKTFNYFVRFLTWSENIIGWILSLLLVAILSGLAKNEKE